MTKNVEKIGVYPTLRATHPALKSWVELFSFFVGAKLSCKYVTEKVNGYVVDKLFYKENALTAKIYPGCRCWQAGFLFF